MVSIEPFFFFFLNHFVSAWGPQCCGNKMVLQPKQPLLLRFSLACLLKCQRMLLKRPLKSLKKIPSLKKPSSFLPDPPPSCPVACTAQRLRNRSRTRRSVHGGHRLAVAWKSKGSAVVGLRALAKAEFHPGMAETTRKSLLARSWAGCCC